ncbi:hypothetical protein CYFUS_004914 [Cystobacter fuscus]|uniref:Uncharacterized protein n=1 Tax=Cystobacter fuscus TaxID=43 RepID=A0A250J7F5_9BACT|nr:hypothetical protein CYFUS_004914 [Cystobacter fuscus]
MAIGTPGGDERDDDHDRRGDQPKTLNDGHSRMNSIAALVNARTFSSGP